MSTEKINMAGKRYNSLVVVSELKARNKNGHIVYECVCDCGNRKVILGASIRTGATKSCGCLVSKVNGKHFMEGTPIYRTWVSMKSRCFNSNNNNYSKYGGRGISMCSKWASSFKSFYADMGDIPKNTSIDRIDNNKGYSLDNCKWSTKKEQALNRRCTVKVFFDGEYIFVHEYAKKIGLSESGARKKARRLGIILKAESLTEK